MKRAELGDLAAFLAVAEERNFTRAAARLGTSQSALSHTIKRLETRLGLRLLSRTTRSVAPTEAGDRLIETLAPAFSDIDGRLAALTALREKPAGTVRITSSEHAAETVLWPVLARLLPDYPDLKVEIAIEPGFVDIVAERYDAGVRLGEAVGRDMIAVPIGPRKRMVVVGSPAYLARNPRPKNPRDLARHNCINLRMRSSGRLYAWEFEKAGRAVNVRVDGQLIFDNLHLCVRAAIAGMGLTFVPEDCVEEDVARGRLVKLLTDWSQPFPGYHLYYPSRRLQSPAFALLVEALRWRSKARKMKEKK
jgi:DNA-binding transcriptional LysR family regulator